MTCKKLKEKMAEANEEKNTPEDEAAPQPHIAEEAPSVIDTLSGQQKATALLVAIGKPTAARLIRHFSPDDLRRLRGQAHNLPDIKMPDFEKLVQQFEDAFTEGASFSQAEERFTSLVQETLPEDEAAAVLDPNPPPVLTQENVFDIIKNMTAEELQQHLVNEHPQVVAYIVSCLPDELAARILLLQTMSMRSNIVQRMLYLKPVQPAVDAIISQALYPILVKQAGNEQKSHYKQIAMVLNQLDKSELDEVLASLESLKAEDLSGIRAGMFTFEDISRLTDRARLLLFDSIPSEIIIKALCGASPELVETILASLSQRTRRMVEAEITIPDEQLSQADILRARREIANTALALANQDIINLSAEKTAV